MFHAVLLGIHALNPLNLQQYQYKIFETINGTGASQVLILH